MAEKMTISRMWAISSRVDDAEGTPRLQRRVMRQMLTDLADAILAGLGPSPQQCARIAIATCIRIGRRHRRRK